MDRKEKLLNIIGKEHNELLIQLVDETIFLEDRLEELKQYPFIAVNPKNPMKQKATPASRQYKEMLQQYTSCIRVIARITGQDDTDEESPLRKWFRERTDNAD